MDQTIVEGDCLAVMRTMATYSIKCAVFSPPYNLNKRYSVHNDKMPQTEYLLWQREVAKELLRVLRADGHLFLNIGWDSKHPWQSVDVAQEYRRFFVLQNHNAWIKSIALDGSTLPKSLREAMHERQVGHFVSLHSDRYFNPVWEDVWHFTPAGCSSVTTDVEGLGVPYVWADQPERVGHNKPRHCRGNAWHIPYRTTQSKADKDGHPSIYPVELARMCLLSAGMKPGEVALDPFMGTGATLLAASELGVEAIGIEIDPAYCAAARRRLEALRTGRVVPTHLRAVGTSNPEAREASPTAAAD
jgi:site-specific DNA-methyltransferase (adenine-specific)